MRQKTHFLDDEKLSWEAKGVLAYYLRQSDKVQVSLKGVREDGGIGRKKTDRIVKELKEAGYLQSDRYNGENGFYYENWLYAFSQSA